MWFTGPKFLWQDEQQWPRPPDSINHGNDFVMELEVKRQPTVAAITVNSEVPALDKYIEHFSDWSKLIRCTAWLLKFKKWLIKKRTNSVDTLENSTSLKIEDLHNAEHSILRYVQNKQKWKTDRMNEISKLDPIIKNELICVGGRLSYSDINDNAKQIGRAHV